jgi:hypothetical protein
MRKVDEQTKEICSITTVSYLLAVVFTLCSPKRAVRSAFLLSIGPHQLKDKKKPAQAPAR